MTTGNDNSLMRRVGRGAMGFVSGLVLTLGVVWASGLGLEDRQRSSNTTALDLSVACITRDGPTAIAYYSTSADPPGWRCARVVDEVWLSEPISPEEGCRLLHGRRSHARVASSDNPFTWECRG